MIRRMFWFINQMHIVRVSGLLFASDTNCHYKSNNYDKLNSNFAG